MLRLLIEDVTLTRAETLSIQIRWKAGATSSHTEPIPLGAPDARRTPAATVELVRALARDSTDAAIATVLNTRALRTGTGQRFTRGTVRYIRDTYAIPSLAEHLRQQGWRAVPDIAAELGVHPSTVKRFALEGVLRAVRVDDKGVFLFAPLTGPLPTAHPGKRFRDRRCFPAVCTASPTGGAV